MEPNEPWMRDGVPVDEASLVEASTSGCGDSVKRLKHLAEIDDDGTDALFPESLKSIAAPGTTCGDSATGEMASCDKYNHWKSITQIRKEQHARGAKAEACAK